MNRQDESLYQSYLAKTLKGLIFKVEGSSFQVIAAGDEFLTLSGIDRTRLLSMNMDQLQADVLHPHALAAIRRVREDRQEMILDPVTAAGRSSPISAAGIRISPLADETGRIAYLMYQTTEAPIQRGEEVLNRDYFARLVNQAPVGMAILRGEELRVESANTMMLELWGKSAELLDLPLVEAMPEMRGTPFLQSLHDVFDLGEPLVGNESPVYFFRNGSLESAYFNFVYQPIKDEKGKITGLMMVANEVTQLVKMKRELQESVSSFRHVVMNAHYALLVLKGDDWVVDIANQPLFDLWGKHKREMIGRPLLDILPELLGQPFSQHLKSVYQTGKAFTTKEDSFYFNAPEGIKKKYVSYFYDPMLDEKGKVYGVIVGAEDITQRVENRLKTERAEEMLRIAIESANLGTWNYDPKSKRLNVSARLKELFGYNQEEHIEYDRFMEQLTEDYRYSILKTIKKAMEQGDEFNLEFSILGHSDQTVRWMSATGKIYRDKEGHPLRFSGILNEITEQKLDEIRKNDFIAMVSHELKTPLTSLKAYVQLLSMKAKQSKDQFAIRSLGKVDGQVNKMNKMIRGFLDLSRLESGKIFLEKESFPIDDLLKEIVEEVSMTDKTHTILFSACKPLSVNADREKIGQVLNNLITNAIKYSPLHSKITIRCEMEGSFVRVSVGDEGIGLAKEDIGKLFDRFYRVKNTQLKTVSGFGIGLYLSAEIVKRHGGEIWVDSEENVGSVFHFSLPAAEMAE